MAVGPRIPIQEHMCMPESIWSIEDINKGAEIDEESADNGKWGYRLRRRPRDRWGLDHPRKSRERNLQSDAATRTNRTRAGRLMGTRKFDKKKAPRPGSILYTQDYEERKISFPGKIMADTTQPSAHEERTGKKKQAAGKSFSTIRPPLLFRQNDLRKYANNQQTRRGKSGRRRTSHTHRSGKDLQGRIGHRNLAAKQERWRARRAEQVGILQATVPIVFWIFSSTSGHDYLLGRRPNQRQKDGRAQTLDGVVAIRVSDKVAEKDTSCSMWKASPGTVTSTAAQAISLRARLKRRCSMVPKQYLDPRAEFAVLSKRAMLPESGIALGRNIEIRQEGCSVERETQQGFSAIVYGVGGHVGTTLCTTSLLLYKKDERERRTAIRLERLPSGNRNEATSGHKYSITRKSRHDSLIQEREKEVRLHHIGRGVGTSTNETVFRRTDGKTVSSGAEVWLISRKSRSESMGESSARRDLVDLKILRVATHTIIIRVHGIKRETGRVEWNAIIIGAHDHRVLKRIESGENGFPHAHVLVAVEADQVHEPLHHEEGQRREGRDVVFGNGARVGVPDGFYSARERPGAERKNKELLHHVDRNLRDVSPKRAVMDNLRQGTDMGYPQRVQVTKHSRVIGRREQRLQMVKENQRDLVGGGTHIPALASAERRTGKKQDGRSARNPPFYMKS
ncbi:hypothetical protein B0H13DRAFT_1918598 [Mycena leptocephala]|nr:hypothetical protein B0H13DRAFT_1918598 [Mycena leptocephala]